MSLETSNGDGNVLAEKGNSEGTAERSVDANDSEDVKCIAQCSRNVTKEPKTSVSENGNIMNVVEKTASGERDEPMPTGSAVNGHFDEKLRRAIEIVVSYSRVSSETKERLKCAVTDVHRKLMTVEEACQCYQLAVPYFQTYYKMVEKVLNRANAGIKSQNRISSSVNEQNGNKVNTKNEGTGGTNHTNDESDGSEDKGHGSDDTKEKVEKKKRKVRKAFRDFKESSLDINTDRLIKCIDEHFGTCKKRSAKKDAISKAVAMVIEDGCTGVDAAKATLLTPRTVMKYVTIVRDALNLPVRRKSRRQFAQEKDKIKEDSFVEEGNDGVHNTAELLLDEEMGFVDAKDFSRTVSELEEAIDELLREFSCGGDLKKVREAIVKVFMEQKKPSDLCKAAEIPVTLLESFVRLVNGLFWVENSVKKIVDSSSSGTFRHVRKDCFSDDEKQGGHRSSTLMESAETKAALPLKRKHKSSDVVQTPRGVFSGKVDVMTLHLESAVKNEEQLIKNIISYLISQQYRRSEVAQTNMQICLEHVLLDGLSVAETLKIHEGPSEGVLEIYQRRCRDAFTFLTVDFPAFIAALNSLNENEANRPRAKKLRVASKKLEEGKAAGIDVANSGNVVEFNSIEQLLASISESAKTPLLTYIMKLLDANFPLEKSLVSGLLHVIAEKTGAKYVFTDEVLEDCVAYFHKKHSGTAV